jgi:hypothetical protein
MCSGESVRYIKDKMKDIIIAVITKNDIRIISNSSNGLLYIKEKIFIYFSQMFLNLSQSDLKINRMINFPSSSPLESQEYKTCSSINSELNQSIIILELTHFSTSPRQDGVNSIVHLGIPDLV